MSSVLHAKRSLERKAGCPVEFRRHNTDTDAPIEVHMVGHAWSGGSRDTTWLGAGEDHHEALADAHETLRVRARIDREECAGDYAYEQRRDREARAS